MPLATKENSLDTSYVAVLEHEGVSHSEFKAQSQSAYGYKFRVT